MTTSELLTLDRSTCLDLVQNVPIGRIAWADHQGRAHVLPVNFIIDDEDSLVFRTSSAGTLDAVRGHRPLTFEADDVEPALKTAWSVVITGIPKVVTDDSEIQRIKTLPLAPWIRSPEPFFVRLALDEVTGRRIPLHPGGVTVEHLDPADEPT